MEKALSFLSESWSEYVGGSSSSESSGSSGSPAATATATMTTSLLQSLSMTILSEIGDKTFFIAAVMAMRYSRTKVFLGAFLAMLGMMLVSVGVGVGLEKVVERKWTQRVAVGLFFSFGAHMLYHALSEEIAKLFTKGSLGGSESAKEQGG